MHYFLLSPILQLWLIHQTQYLPTSLHTGASYLIYIYLVGVPVLTSDQIQACSVHTQTCDGHIPYMERDGHTYTNTRYNCACHTPVSLWWKKSSASTAKLSLYFATDERVILVSNRGYIMSCCLCSAAPYRQWNYDRLLSRFVLIRLLENSGTEKGDEWKEDSW